MPRDPSGNYTLPALGNPAVTNTPITIAWWNGTGTDLAAALTNSFDRTGATGGMTGPFKAVDGTAGAPGITFASEPTTGFYRPTAGEMDWVVGGVRFVRLTSAGFAGSADGGASWKFPLWSGFSGQTVTTGSIDFTAGTLLVGGLPVQAKVTRSSTSSGTFSTTSTSYTAVTNANITFTSTGGIVLVQVVPDDTSNLAYFQSRPTSGTSTPVMAGLDVALSADAGSTFFAQAQLNTIALYNGVFYDAVSLSPSCFSTWYAPAAGAGKTIGLYVKGHTGCSAIVNYCKLLITQL